MIKKALQFLLVLTLVLTGPGGTVSAEVSRTVQEQFNRAVANDTIMDTRNQFVNNQEDVIAYDNLFGEYQQFSGKANDAYNQTGMDGLKDFTPGNQNEAKWLRDMQRKYRAAERKLTDDFNEALENGDYDKLDNLSEGLSNEERRVLDKLKNDNKAKIEELKEKLGLSTQPPAGSKDRPYDLSDLEVETDADGNIIGFKEKDFEEKDTDGDGKISQEEREAWEKKKKEEEENAGGGGPAGGPGGAPGAGGAGGGQIPPNQLFKLQCWVCNAPPLKHTCDKGLPGGCEPHPCEYAEQECTAHEEFKVDGTKLICHECGEIPPPYCEKNGYHSGPACGGTCSDGKCEEVVIAPDGTVRTGTRLRTDTICYQCVKRSSCEDKGYFEDPACLNKCVPVDACNKVYLKPSGGTYRDDESRVRGAKECYQCANDDDIRPECKYGFDDPACYGQCSPYECKKVGQYTWRDKLYHCYGCEIDPKNPCTDGGVLDANCNNACRTSEICKPAYPVTLDGQQKMCHMCQKRPTTGSEPACDGTYLDDPGCSHDCDADECVLADTVTHNGKKISCYNCIEKDSPPPPPPPPKECPAGTSPDPMCQGYCDTLDCNKVTEYTDPETGKKVSCYGCVADESGECKSGRIGACDIVQCESPLLCHDHGEIINGQQKICHVCSGSITEPKFCRYGAIGACDVANCISGYTCSDYLEKFEGKTIICHNCHPGDYVPPEDWTDPPHHSCSRGQSGYCKVGACPDDKECLQHVELDELGMEHVCYSCDTHKCRKGYPGTCDTAKCETALGGTYCRTHVEAYQGREVLCHTCGGNDDRVCEDFGFQDACQPEETCIPYSVENGKQCCQCYKKPAEPGEEKCEKANPGPCANNGSCASTEECIPANEMHSGQLNHCHRCESIVKDPCENVECPSDTQCKKYACVQGECKAKLATGPCDDKDACTEGDHCASGECVAGKAVSVPASTACIQHSCDAKEGVKKTILTGADCDDGDQCTGQDKCNAEGACVGRPITGCGDPCHDVTCPAETDCVLYKCVAGDCVSENKEGACDDNDACTSADQCSAGACQGSPVEVPSDTSCKSYTCDKTQGLKEEIKTGTSCDDGDVCTGQDVCQQDGSCQGRPITGCDSDCQRVMPGSTSDSSCGGQCSSELCEGTPVYGANNSTGIAYYCYKCKDDPCAGVTCPSDTACVSYQCVNGDCAATNKEGPCDDSDACTSGDQCSGGECRGTPVEVPSGETCMAYRCDPSQGIVKEPKTGSSCDDGDVCTGQDTCNADGSCAGRPITGCGKTCADEQLKPGACPGTCDPGSESCSPVNLSGGVQCHNCYPMDAVNSCADSDMSPGACPGYCSIGDKCTEARVAGDVCHTCERDPCYYAQRQSGGCPGTCSKDTKCEATTIDGEECHWCLSKAKEPQCRYGYSPGSCDGHACSSDERCFQLEGPCFVCRKWTCDPPLMDASGCDACHAQGGKCWPIMTLAAEVGNAPQCFRCDKPESCEAYGELSACFECPSGTICIPGHTINDPFTKQALRCVNCLRPTSVEVEYYILVIETPFYRVVLGDDGKDRFEPSSVMALAKSQGGKLANTLGEMKKITSLFGGLNAGLGPAGFVTSGNISMDQLSGILQSQLDKGGSFGAGCFDEVVDKADERAAQEGTPTSEDIKGISKARKQDKTRREQEVFSKEQMKEADEAGTPAVNGPLVACGNEGRNKVLKIYDAAGVLVDTVTKDMLELNPNIVSEKLNLAQHLSDISVQLGGNGISDYVQKFTGLPVREMQSYASQIQKYKAMADQAADMTTKKKKKKRKEEPAQLVFPNDPLYQAPGEKKKKKLLGILGSNKKAAAITIGSAMKMGAGTVGGPSGSSSGGGEDIKDQWGLHEIGFTPWDDPDSAWNVVPVTEKNIVVAVIDSGLDMGHPDAPEFIWTNPKEIPDNGVDDDKNGFIDDVHGWNFLEENHDFTDRRGHGTFVAGIIAAKINNEIGIAGINPGAVIMPLVVADEEGETESLSIFRAINYAVNHGAKVINVSLGAPGISKIEQLAIQRAHDMGVLVVVAAGNTNDDIREFGPSSSKHVLAVGQIDFSGVRSTVSSQGANLALLAPGEQIYSLCSRDTKDIKPSLREFGYYKLDGTSFAAPMVSATASLIWAKNPDLTNDQVRSILLETATDMNDEGWDGMTGAGLLNAAAAMRASADESVTVMITNLRVNTDVRDKAISLDMYGSVRGDVREYYIEVGKGKRADKFETVAGPFRDNIEYKLIDRIDIREHMRGSNHWIIRLRVVGADGQERIASTHFELP